MARNVVHALAASAAIAGLCAAAAAGDGITTTPSSIDLTLDPGDVASVDVEVCIPGQSGVAQADVYFLADTTGSMFSIIDQVKSDAAAITSNLLGRPGIDVQIGIGNYKDFPFDAFAFQHQQAVTDDSVAINAAINTWVATGGSDGSEGQLFALHEIATEAAIGWRTDSKRIIVWFGDAPGHDPVCNAISGEGVDVTEGSATAELVAAGPGGTVVIAISTLTGFALGLNDDPTSSASDYAGFCVIGGASGQADRIAAATDGVSLSGVSSGNITDAILDAIDVVLTEVDVSLQAKGDAADFIDSISPGTVSVVIPDDPADEVCATFTVNFSGDDCVENASAFSGNLNVLIDGAASGVSIPVSIDQPACDTLCLLFVGFGPAADLIPHAAADAGDFVYVAQPFLSFPVTMEDIPFLGIPDDPALSGLHVYTQVGMFNTFDFPADPIQMSNGLDFTVGGDGIEYGSKSGITQWCDGPSLIGGSLQIGFQIDAWAE